MKYNITIYLFYQGPSSFIFLLFVLALNTNGPNGHPPDYGNISNNDETPAQNENIVSNDSILLNGLTKHESIESIPKAEVI